MGTNLLRLVHRQSCPVTPISIFPQFPPHGRIPNFAGADEAADLLAETEVLKDATAIKANPDAPQRLVRRGALRAGKTVFQAVTRLTEERAFLELDPDRIDDYREATTVSGSAELGRPVYPDQMPAVDLVVSGSVAVDTGGARIGRARGTATSSTPSWRNSDTSTTRRRS